ncbi:MAG: hypothetical protein IMZ54_11695 [Acidobacteria bacterium]|nr:hypothetical protein [Acidobacteriota bacterium]MBE3131360.1 hypothetical protein [Acidobacteriota bacterium]
MRLTEHPFVNDKSGGAKALVGRFDTKKKYPVLSVYETDQFTDFLLADEDGVFHWVSSEICRKA